MSRSRGAPALLLAAIVAATGAAPSRAAELEPVPAPNLEQVEPAVRELLEESRRSVDDLLAVTTAPPALLADAFGRLGQLYYLYGLLDASRAAFRNARGLAPADHRWPYYLGVLYAEAREVEAAEEAFGAVLELRPDDHPTLIRLGRLAIAANRPEDAERWFRRALETMPDSAAAHHGLGQAAFLGGDFEQAVERFETVLAAQPQAAAVRYQLGLAYRELGDLERARDNLSRHGRDTVVFADPLTDGLAQLTTGASIHIVRGTRAFSAGRYDLAVEAYRAALDADPDNLTARQSLASALAITGDRSGALEQYREVLRRDPDNAIAHYNAGTLLVGRGEFEDAIEAFRRATELAPDLKDAHFNLSLALERSGRPEEGLAAAGKTLDLDPQDSGARLHRANLLGRLGRYRESEAELDRLLAADPGNTDALLSRGTLMARTGRPREALESYGRVLELETTPEIRGTAHLFLGNFHNGRGATERAIGHYREAAALSPGPGVHLALASTLGRAGRFAEAAEAFAAAVALEPANEEAHFGLATARILAGQDREARTGLEAALEELPESLPLRHALARLLATSADDQVRDGPRALALARQAFESRRALDHAETVAMALAELGRFEEAAGLQRRVVEQARAEGAGARLPALEERLRRYERGEPVRSPWHDRTPPPGAA